jgi:hypothetical protein
LTVGNELVVVIFVKVAFEIDIATWVSVCSIEDALPNGIDGLQKGTKRIPDPPGYFLGSLKIFLKVRIKLMNLNNAAPQTLRLSTINF